MIGTGIGTNWVDMYGSVWDDVNMTRWYLGHVVMLVTQRPNKHDAVCCPS
jgi:hypothetical protein